MKKNKLILFIGLLLIGLLSVMISASDGTEQVGFFENLTLGFFDFVTSEEFTKIATSLSALLLSIYPFVRKYLSTKAQSKFNKLAKDLSEWKNLALEEKKEKIRYAKMVDHVTKQVEAISQSLLLGFDKSNLKTEFKDKINSILTNVPTLETVVIKDEPINVEVKKDNILTEDLENKIEEPVANNSGW